MQPNADGKLFADKPFAAGGQHQMQFPPPAVAGNANTPGGAGPGATATLSGLAGAGSGNLGGAIAGGADGRNWSNNFNRWPDNEEIKAMKVKLADPTLDVSFRLPFFLFYFFPDLSIRRAF